MRNLLMHSPIVVALCWIIAFLFFTVLPLLVLLIYPPPAGRGFWLEFSVALGFIGLALTALQFALTTRVNRIEASYGIDDLVLAFHRYTSFRELFGIVLESSLVVSDRARFTLADYLYSLCHSLCQTLADDQETVFG
ncbi:hypothetical protein ACQ4M3_23155 [Leptolyngbya sp. AN03gr2]|uniref:hypothetical protein n=1 Tax=unclassified Leptolyngbya TaxID=2650499 RepID=UPI003D31E2CD